MPSKRANRYGTLAERYVAKQRNLRRSGEHTSWCDAVFQNGTPVEIKSADVRTGYFQIYRKYHKKIRQADGWYAFVVYKPKGQGINVLKSRFVKPDKLPLQSMWSPTGGHRDSDKAKVAIEDIF